jgi:hypothetical protein
MKTVNFLRFYLSQKSVILITSTEHRPLNKITCERLTMKTIKYAAAAIALTTLSFGAFAAQPVSPSQAESMNKIGVVSAEGATTLDGLEAKLAEKAKPLARLVTASPPLTPTTKLAVPRLSINNRCTTCINPERPFNTLVLPVRATGRAFFASLSGIFQEKAVATSVPPPGSAPAPGSQPRRSPPGSRPAEFSAMSAAAHFPLRSAQSSER